MTLSQRARLDSAAAESGILNERVLLLVFESLNWDLQIVCSVASVNRKLRALAKRILWRHLCFYRAPRMVSTLTDGGGSSSNVSRLGGGWHALAKLLFYCCGCQPTRHFSTRHPLSGHLAKASRFSKTAGQSFLPRRCRSDLLYVCDPCEHDVSGSDEDLGVYRGVFRGFMRSRTRASLIDRQVELEEQRVRCPYCRARVWSMTNARMVPRSAARRLGTRDGGLEYFVCVNGHLYGSCWLVPLSSDEGVPVDDDDDDDEEDEEDDGSGEIAGKSRYDSGGPNPFQIRPG